MVLQPIVRPLQTDGDGLQVPAWTGASAPGCWLCACDVFAKPTHLRSAESGCLAVTGTMTNLGSRNFAVAGAKVWNSLPVDLRLLSRSLHTFGHKLKHYLFVSEPWAHLRFFKVALYKFSHYYYCLRWQTVGPALQLLPTNHCPDLPHAHTRWLLLISRPAEGRRLSWLELTMDSTVAPYQGCLQLD